MLDVSFFKSSLVQLLFRKSYLCIYKLLGTTSDFSHQKSISSHQTLPHLQNGNATVHKSQGQGETRSVLRIKHLEHCLMHNWPLALRQIFICHLHVLKTRNCMFWKVGIQEWTECIDTMMELNLVNNRDVREARSGMPSMTPSHLFSWEDGRCVTRSLAQEEKKATDLSLASSTRSASWNCCLIDATEEHSISGRGFEDKILSKIDS